MKTKTTTRNWMLLLAGAIVSLPAFAQEDENKESDDIFELSPFTVSAEDNQGYMATSSLAGTRLKTDLRDIGAAVSVYTEEFLEDIDATSVEDILTYTTSTEGGGINGNFAGFTGESSDDVRGNPSSVTRIRAFAPATRTRDYFISDIPTDTYSYSRLTVNRGPNAILAGIGSGGGIVDASLRKAQFNDRTSVRFRYGEHGAHREEIHINREIFEDRLAFRIDGLNEHLQFRQEPTYERDERIYMAATLKLRKRNPNAFLGSTTLRANMEIGSIHGTPPNMLTPVMSVTSWFPGQHPANGIDFADKWYADGADRKIYDKNGNPIWKQTNPRVIDPTQTFIAGFQLFRQWALVFSDPNSPQPGVGFTDPALANIQGYIGVVAGSKPGGWLRATGDRNRNRQGFYRTRLQNPEVFDYYNNLLTGVFDNRQQSFDATDVRLEQLFWDGKAGVEFAYNRQHFKRSRDIPISGENEVYIDTTKYLSIRNDEYNTNPNGPLEDQRIENPNFGRAFVVSRDMFRDQVNMTDRESYQINAYINHDFTESDTGLGKLLGRHTLSGLLFKTDIERGNQTFKSSWQEGGDLGLKDSTGNVPGSFPAQVYGFFYLSDPLFDANSEDDIRLNPITTGRPVAGQDYTLRVWDTVQQKFVTGTATPNRIGGVPNNVVEEIKSTALTLQSHWLGDHVSTLISWRRDESEAVRFNFLPPPGNDGLDDITGEYQPEFLVPGDVVPQEQDSWTKSVVVHFPEKHLGELPFGADLRFFWNESENFEPVGIRRNQWNEDLGSPNSMTQEYGIGLSLADGKFNLRFNRFRTISGGRNVPNVPNAYGYINTLINRYVAANALDLVPSEWNFDGDIFQNFEQVARAMFDTIPERLRGNMGPEFNFDPRFVGSGADLTWEPDSIVGKASVSQTVSRGTEVEAIWNPNRNWRFMINVAKNKAGTANAAVDELEFAYAWRANLENMYGGDLLNGDRNPGQAADSPIWPQYQNETLADILTANALSGTATPEIREWRVNVVSRYRFTDGLFKGATVGVNLRWQDKIGIGYPLIPNEGGDLVGDINNPYFGPSDFKVDLNLGYTKKISVFGKKVDWTVRLNIRNINADDELIPIRANSDGSYGTVRIPPERTWNITNSFSW